MLKPRGVCGTVEESRYALLCASPPEGPILQCVGAVLGKELGVQRPVIRAHGGGERSQNLPGWRYVSASKLRRVLRLVPKDDRIDGDFFGRFL